jgi:hypothetical protein
MKVWKFFIINAKKLKICTFSELHNSTLFSKILCQTNNIGE